MTSSYRAIVGSIGAALAIGLAILYILRRSFEPIKSRGMYLQVVTVLAVLFADISWTVWYYVDATPCWIGILAQIVIPAFVYMPLVLRGFACYFMCKLSVEKRNYMSSGVKGFHLRHQWLVSAPFQTVVLALFFGTLLVVSIFLQPNTRKAATKSFEESCLDGGGWVEVVASFALIAVMVTVLVPLLWKSSETFAIRQELALQCFMGFLAFLVSVSLPNQTTRTIGGIIVLYSSILIPLGLPLLLSRVAATPKSEPMMHPHPSQVTNLETGSTIEMVPRPGSSQGSKAGTSGSGSLRGSFIREHDALHCPAYQDLGTILKDPIIGPAFEKFCQDSWCAENIRFYTDVELYKGEVEAEARKQRAITLRK
eukprot:Colp12_sorted_trinity150504_noHs@33960